MLQTLITPHRAKTFQIDTQKLTHKYFLILCAFIIIVTNSKGQATVTMILGNPSYQDSFQFKNVNDNSFLLDMPFFTSNIFMGKDVGLGITGNDNIGFGRESHFKLTSGSHNIGIGSYSLNQNMTGYNNIGIGTEALNHTTTYSNIGIGYQSLYNNASGFNNIAIGEKSLNSMVIGKNNTVIGDRAGYSTMGDGNVFIGSHAGYSEIGSNKLYIDNQDYSAFDALIYGEFDTRRVKITGLSNNGTTAALEINNSLLLDGISIESKSNTLSLNGQQSTIIGKFTKPNAAIVFGVENNDTVAALTLYTPTSRMLLDGDEIDSDAPILINSNSGQAVVLGKSGSNAQHIINGAENNGINSTLKIANGADALLLDGNEIDGNGTVYLNTNSGNSTLIGKTTMSENVIYGKDNNGSTAALKISDGVRNLLLDGNEIDGDGTIYLNSNDSMNVSLTREGSGKVGIGVYSPTHKLHLKSNSSSGNLMLLQANNGSHIFEINHTPFGGNTSVTGSFNITSSLLGSSLPDLNKALQVNNNFFVNTYGQLKIGALGAPTADLHIKQSGNVEVEGIKLEINSDTNHWRTYIDIGKDYNFEYNGILKSYINDATGAYVTLSDKKLKNNIKPLASSISKINLLSPSQYQYNGDLSSSKSFGFIAQEVREIFPEFVMEKNGQLGIAYEFFIPVAIRGIQELSEENTALKNQVNDLEKRLAKIEALLLK